jgi:hypothetical protein
VHSFVLITVPLTRDELLSILQDGAEPQIIVNFVYPSHSYSTMATSSNSYV